MRVGGGSVSLIAVVGGLSYIGKLPCLMGGPSDEQPMMSSHIKTPLNGMLKFTVIRFVFIGFSLAIYWGFVSK